MAAKAEQFTSKLAAQQRERNRKLKRDLRAGKEQQDQAVADEEARKADEREKVNEEKRNKISEKIELL